MTNRDFINWGLAIGIDKNALAAIDRIASIPIDEKTVRTDCFYSPESIVDLWETNGLNIDPGSHGFVIVGGCANGDPIALSISPVDIGSVWYIDHERMHDEDLREIGIKVATDVTEFYDTLCDDSGFPYDFSSASKGTRG